MKKFIVTAVGALALIAGTAGVTDAVTTPAPARIHAYYSNSTHALYFSSSSTHPTGTTAISWLRNGTAGPAGIDVTAKAKFNAAGVRTVALNCPSDHPYLVAGGGGGDYPEMLEYNGPYNMGHGWRVTVHSSNGSYPAESIYVHVICAR